MTGPGADAVNDERPFALTVGPVLGYWSRRALHDFYADMADSCAETVVIGEVVCARRREMKLDDWLALGDELRSAGKEVVLGTQVLIESESDLRLLRRQAEQRDFLVEAGDASALNVLAGADVPFVLGPHINIYSAAALREHRRLGAVRWVAPAELPLASLPLINPPAPSDGAAPIAIEVLAFGRLPLAFSARCFTARHHKLSKDSCDFRCADDADGLLLSTTDGTPFLALNGIQTLSAARHCLIGERAALRAAGVTRLRLSPSAAGFAEVLALFDAVMNHDAPAQEARRQLEAMAWPGGLANGYASGGAGLQWTAANA
jgi:O2-independent ubiquinone biosynthesis protein UbiV